MLSGILTPGSFTALLLQIHSAGKSGELVCEVEGKSFTFSIDQRHLVHAQASQMEESFPYFLLVHQVLNQQELAFIANSSRSLRTAEELLFQSEIIDQEMLLSYQIKYFESLFRVIHQKTGHYSFSLSLQTTTKPIRYPLTEGILLLLREDQSEDWYLSHMPVSCDSPIRAVDHWSQQAGDYRLSDSEANTLALLVQPSTLTQLFSSLSLPRKEILKQVYLLASIELLCTAPPPAQPERDASVSSSVPIPSDGESPSDTHWESHLQQRLQKLQESTYYQILGVAESAGTADIKQAYYTLAKKYHPDHFFGSQFSPKVRSLVFELFEKIRKAHEVLKDSGSREKYDQDLRDTHQAETSILGVQETDSKPGGEQAESYYLRGIRLTEDQQFETALPFLRYAVTLSPEVPGYHTALAKALKHNLKYKKEAEEHFLRSIELDPLQVENYIELGLFYKEAGFPKRAENQFKSALHHDPRNKTALQELKHLAAGEREAGSIFGKILGSKGKKLN